MLAPNRPENLWDYEKEQTEKWHQLNRNEVITLYIWPHAIKKNGFEQSS